MKPVIAIIGRPNVGKSTLFNRLTRSRTAIVEDIPGVTRDRLYGEGRIGSRDYLVVDTGGIESDSADDPLAKLVAQQVDQVIEDSDVLALVVDGRSGPLAEDAHIVGRLRGIRKPVYVLVNKSEGVDPAVAVAEFHRLGLEHVYAISALHGDGINPLCDELLSAFPRQQAEEQDAEAAVRICVVGRPNVGKSTVINTLLGETRVVVYDHPGTTRDSVEVPFDRDGRRYILVDTAGVRRKSKISGGVERFSIIRSIQAISESNVVMLILDARQGVLDQDATLAGLVQRSGKSIVIALNKWDGLERSRKTRIQREMKRKLPFLPLEETRYISALHGSGVGELWGCIDQAYESAMIALGTGEVNAALRDATQAVPPPMVGHRRIKLKYAHQGGKNPPRIVVHGNLLKQLPDSYRRYLAGFFRKRFHLVGTNVQMMFKQSENPYAGRSGRKPGNKRRS